MIVYDENGYPKGEEPTQEQIYKHMIKINDNYYTAREQLRELAYGGKPPNGFSSWGDFWKYGV